MNHSTRAQKTYPVSMTIGYQPLLANPTQSSHAKFLCIALPLVALLLIVGSFSLFASHEHPIILKFSGTISISKVCENAHDPSSCLAMVSEATSNNGLFETNNVDPLKIFLAKTKPHIRDVLNKANELRVRINNEREQAAVLDCVELMELSMERVVDSLDALIIGSNDDAHAWLDGVLTNHFTCLDGLSGPARSMMEPGLDDLIARARASLAMLVAIKPKKENGFIGKGVDEFPSWLSSLDRKLLETPRRDLNVNANLVVAQDGSGNYKTVKEAVAAAPNNGKIKYVIYVKKGTYKENVKIAKKNIMLVGDGMDLTIITGSLNVVDGATTFNSATVAATGDGFMAQDIWFQNTAGAQKHQAVALRVGADQTVINRCRIDAYQDTLYAHSLRQFYRDSIITGTVDFIFGNAAVVFQNCQLTARKPMAQQFNTVTAQGREDPNQNTGTSIQNCQITASSDLQPVQSTFKSYLGRPWKQYSRTVVMQSYIANHIDPTGWSVWSGDFALGTLYYGEYANRGPGSSTSKRVNWAGYHVITSATEASKFTVAQLIQGASWIQSTGVTYNEGL
ncbi:hypothetical protein Droror1_Dr00020694 [Drosera rotundifolia]